MGLESPRSLAAERRLPAELRDNYRQLVDQYHFFDRARYGRSRLAYETLADLVLAGWRPSGDVHLDTWS